MARMLAAPTRYRSARSRVDTPSVPSLRISRSNRPVPSDVPFLAKCIEERAVSPLEEGDEVEVIGMAPERESGRGMFVSITWGKHPLAVPLAQWEVIHADEQTREAVEDWHYWVGMGYEF
jgi:hypothetical protein